MGLSLCFSVAQEHGGRLWAEPCQTGACLVLELPAWSGAGGSAAKEAKQDAR